MASNKRARQKAARQAKLKAQAARRRRKRLIVQGVIAAIVIILVIVILAIVNTSSSKTAKSENTSSASGLSIKSIAPSNACPPGFESATRITNFSSASPLKISTTKTYYANFLTDVGVIKVKLNPQLAPINVNSFIFLGCHKFYNGTIFHRVVTDFVDQGGSPNGSGNGGPGYTLPDEYPKGSPNKHPYASGQLAMANTGQGHSAGSQFFFVVSQKAAQTLDQNVDAGSEPYTILGSVVEGVDVVNKINQDGTPSGMPKIVHKIIEVSITSSLTK